MSDPITTRLQNKSSRTWTHRGLQELATRYLKAASSSCRWRGVWLCTVLLMPCCTAEAQSNAQGTASAQRDPSQAPTRVLASVGESLITLGDVNLELGRTASSRSDLPPVPEPVLMAAVDIIAQRRQALESLKKSQKRVPESAIDQWLVENSPAELKLSAAQALAARAEAAQVSPQNYREFLAFRLSWPAYLQTALTETNLKKHFKNQQARFDGTRFEVEHLWIPVPPGKSAARQAAHARLATTGKRVREGQVQMADAAVELLGDQASDEAKAAAAQAARPQWLTGGGPLMPRVVDHVLKTAAGEITEPFDSASAVHLVRVIRIEPGQLSFEQAQDDVRKHTLVYLLEFLAQKSAADMPLVWLAKE